MHTVVVHLQFGRHLFMLSKLAAIVRGDGFDWHPHTRQQLDHRRAHDFSGSVLYLGQQRQLTLALGQ